MGADMLAVFICFKEDESLKDAKDRMLKRIETLTKEGDDKRKIESFFEEVTGESNIKDVPIEDIRKALTDYVNEGFEPIEEGSHDVCSMSHKEDTIYITGGMSYGDDPTESFGPMANLTMFIGIFMGE